MESTEREDTPPSQNHDSRHSNHTIAAAAAAPHSSKASSNNKMCTTGTRRRLRRNRGGSESQFPGKLYDMLEYVAENDLESAVSWARNGTAVMVHDPDKLVEILPKFFGQTKYRSFRRQLNMWHFHRIMEGPHRGAFMHPCFIRGNKQRIAFMSRHVHVATASPTVPSPTDFPSPGPRKTYEEWKALEEQYQHQQQGMGMVHPWFQQYQSVDINSSSNSYDNVPLSSLDPQMSTTDFSYNVTPLPQLLPERSDERIQFEPSAICLTESPVLSSDNKFQGFSIEHLNDGDPISFAGRQFHFVDYHSPHKKKTEGPEQKPMFGKPHSVRSRRDGYPSYREEHVGMNAIDAFADDAPMIVSDALLEPLTSEIIETIFGLSNDND